MDLSKEVQELTASETCVVYYHTGNGFEKYDVRLNKSLQSISFAVTLPVDTDCICIIPGKDPGIIGDFKLDCNVKYNTEILDGAVSGKDMVCCSDFPKIMVYFEGKANEISAELEYIKASNDNEKALLNKYVEKVNAVNSLEGKCKSIESKKVQNVSADSEIKRLTADIDLIHNSLSWRITAPLRKITGFLKTLLIFRALIFLRTYGIKATIKRVLYGNAPMPVDSNKLEEISRDYYISDERRQEEEGTSFPKDIKFSVLVPLYNTPKKFLKEMIESVQAQTYKNWELCLADGSDAEHDDVGDICKKYAEKDERIIYKKLEKNLGISENTNACIEMATGSYIALFDHDDLLHPSALYEVMRAICEHNADYVYTDENTFSEEPKDAYNPHFKPDFSPDTLRSYNYICHFSVFSKELLDSVGYFRSEYDGSQDYDLILRLTEKANKVFHIRKILYYWRAHKNSVAQNVSAKPYTIVSAKKALNSHLERLGLKGEACDSSVPTTYHIKYDIDGEPLISIIIPNKDHTDDLDKCIKSIYEKSSYKNFEFVIVENNSTEPETFAYYEKLKKEHDNVKVVVWEGIFNYSAINNFGAQFADGEVILLLNNDVEIINEDCLTEMLMFAQRKDVGAVGAKLYYPDDTIQHAGVILGIGGIAGHSHKYFPRTNPGYSARTTIAQNLTACTAACLMMRREVFDEVGGLDEAFTVAFNDVDLCMKIRKAGYLIVFTPYSELYHYESKSRGAEDTPEKVLRFQGEIRRFESKWQKELDDGDPYYSPHLTLIREDFSFK